MKKECISMLLAGGQGSRLYALTSKAAKPIMPFGGKYRIIDFPLSNCANSGIDVVGVMTQYEPFQLNSYIGNGQPWDLDLLQGGVFILPPYQSSGEKGGWFSGTANAIYQNRNFVSQWDPEYVLILGGDQIYKMDYSKMLEEHKKNNADCTIAVIPVTMEEAKRFGIMSVGEDGYVCKFTEKPKNPDSNLASMGIYIFTWKKLLAYLTADDTDAKSSKDFGKNIIPTMLKNGEKLWPFRFEGYWRDVGTIDSLWESNMDVLDPDIIDLFNADWPIRSRSPRKPPHYIGNTAKINLSIITEGCEIYGAVDHSVLSNSVTVAKGAKVTHSVLMPGCKIGPGAQVSYSIIGENAVVGKNCVIGTVPEDEAGRKITTLGPGSSVGEDTVLEAGAMVYAEKEENK